MASWSAMDALLDARAAWERSQPQMFFDFDVLEGGADDSFPGALAATGTVLTAASAPPSNTTEGGD